MEYIYHISGKTVFLTCGEEWKRTADFLAAILKKEEDAGGVLQDGNILQIGWSFYKFIKWEEGLRMVTFDYAEDPFTAVKEDLSLSLRIFDGQAEILNRAKAEALTTSFQDTMLIKRTAMTAPAVYLQRLEPTGEGDSGWYMGVIGEEGSDDPGDYTRIYTYQLLSFCEAALMLMPLPLGTIALLEGGQLVEVVDENNQKLI